ncbi:MAG: hypothetical protein M3R17_20325, partial [Bacteroidota bacterium]|nr:hypothetical protein [Bacteroidota bacterium]
AEMFKQDPQKRTLNDKGNDLTSAESILLQAVLSKNVYLSDKGYSIEEPAGIYKRVKGKYLSRNFFKEYYSEHKPIRVLG